MSRSLPLDLSYLLSDYVLLEADFPVLIFTMDGQAIRCNQFAEELLGETIIRQGVEGIFIDFLETANIEEWAAADQSELRSVSTANGMPESFRFCFQKSGGYILAIGNRDTQNIKQLEQTTVELCQDLSNATRELHRKNAELKKLNDMKNQFWGGGARYSRSNRQYHVAGKHAVGGSIRQIGARTHPVSGNDHGSKYLHAGHAGGFAGYHGY